MDVAVAGNGGREGVERARRNVARAVACVGALVAAIGTLLATTDGVGVTPDSLYYLSSAENLAAGRGFLDFGLTRLTTFPPGFPALVAMLTKVGLSPTDAARWVNVLAAAGIVWLTGALLRRHVRWNALVVWGTLFVAVAVPLLSISRMAWSEPVFVAVVLGFVLVIDRAAPDRDRSWWWLGVAVALAWAAFLVRYSGLSLLPAGALVVIVAGRARWRAAVVRAAAFLAAGLVIPVAWMARNHAADGTLMGPRPASADGLGDALSRVVDTVELWARPNRQAIATSSWVAWLVLGLVAAVFVAWAITVVRSRGDDRPSGRGGGAPATAVVIVAGVYAAYLVVAQVTTAFDTLDNRLLSPLYPLVVVLVAVALDRILGRLPVPPRRPVGIVTVVVLVALLVASGVRWVQIVSEDHDQGLNPVDRIAAVSPVILALDDLPEGAMVYTNLATAAWWYSGHMPVRPSPYHFENRSEEDMPIPQSFVDTVACQPTWYAELGAGGGNAYTAAEMASVVDVELVQEWPEGRLYRLTPKPGSVCP